MRILFLLSMLCCVLSACESQQHEHNSIQQQIKKWPSSTLFHGANNTFTISLANDLQGLELKKVDTLQTIFGRVEQKVYLIEQDTLSLMISIATYDQDIFEKRKSAKLYESTLNHFLHELKANRTRIEECSKIIQGKSTTGVRTFFAMEQEMKSYYGVSELYAYANRLHHIVILSQSKDSFLSSQSIALAFHSFMPQ